MAATPLLLVLEVVDVDVFARRAIEAGAQVELPVREMFWAERYGVLRDPFGFRCAVSTVREDLSPEEVAPRVPSDVRD